MPFEEQPAILWGRLLKIDPDEFLTAVTRERKGLHQLKDLSLFDVARLIDEGESAQVSGQTGPTGDHHVGIGAGVFDPGSGLL